MTSLKQLREPMLDIMAIDRIEARLTPWDWPFLRTHRAEIDDHWASLSQGKAELFNGRVILQHRSHTRIGEDGARIVEAEYFETDYAAFVARKHLAPASDPVRNGFAMAALKANDGAYLLGIMGGHTFNAGKIYFAAGTPDLDDVRADGTVDLEGSVLRELEEETGLRRDEVSIRTGWEAVTGRHEIAFMRHVGLDLDAESARAEIMARIARQMEPELAGIAIVRSVSDIDAERMPPFMQAYLRWVFGS